MDSSEEGLENGDTGLENELFDEEINADSNSSTYLINGVKGLWNEGVNELAYGYNQVVKARDIVINYIHPSISNNSQSEQDGGNYGSNDTANTQNDALLQSINVVSAPSGAEWYDREWRTIKAANPGWSDNQVTAKMSEMVWNNDYKALMNDIANSSTPEEREQKIREHQWELDNYKASGIDVDNDEKYLRDTQGMPSESIFNKVISLMSNYSPNSVEPQYSVSPTSSFFGEIPKEGINLQKGIDLQIQKKEEEDKVYDAHAQQFNELVEKVQKTLGMGSLHELTEAYRSDYNLGRRAALNPLSALLTRQDINNHSEDFIQGFNYQNNQMYAFAPPKYVEAIVNGVMQGLTDGSYNGPMVSGELVTGGSIVRSTVTNLPSNIYFNSSKGNESSSSNYKGPSGTESNTAESPALKDSPYNPETVADRVKPEYKANPAHDQTSPLFNPKKTPEPADAAQVYQNAVRADMGTWYGQGADSQIYRYFSDNAGGVHFSGTVSKEQVPADVLRQLGIKY